MRALPTLTALTALAIAVAVLFWMDGRYKRTGPTEFFLQQSRKVNAQTVPVNSQIIGISSVMETEFAAEQSWDFETQREWSDYCNWVKWQLDPDYHLAREKDGQMVFVKQLQGDVLSVQIEQKTEGPPQQIHVVFSGTAD